jgi:hypothetical protein
MRRVLAAEAEHAADRAHDDARSEDGTAPALASGGPARTGGGVLGEPSWRSSHLRACRGVSARTGGARWSRAHRREDVLALAKVGVEDLVEHERWPAALSMVRWPAQAGPCAHPAGPCTRRGRVRARPMAAPAPARPARRAGRPSPGRAGARWRRRGGGGARHGAATTTTSRRGHGRREQEARRTRARRETMADAACRILVVAGSGAQGRQFVGRAWRVSAICF